MMDILQKSNTEINMVSYGKHDRITTEILTEASTQKDSSPSNSGPNTERSMVKVAMLSMTSTATVTAAKNNTTMAGDHRCPVCQATFTRPQHVSRHMRSRKMLRHRSSRRAQTSHTQIPAITHTSVGVVETSSPEGLSSLHLPSPAAPLISISPISPLCSSSQAISSRDTSTNAIPTRNLPFLQLLLI
jgi:hypothetical protein